MARISTKLAEQLARRAGIEVPKRKRVSKGLAAKSELEEEFAMQIRALGLPAPERQVKPLTDRQYVVDFLWREYGLVIEVDGGTKQMGRHQRPAGYVEDRTRDMLMLRAGLITVRITRDHIANGTGHQFVRDWTSANPPEALLMARARITTLGKGP